LSKSLPLTVFYDFYRHSKNRRQVLFDVRGLLRFEDLDAVSVQMLSMHLTARSVLREMKFAINSSSHALKLDQSLNMWVCRGA
jgi:hypothetical protein